MLQLVYASTAIREFSDGELFEMLVKYREKNDRLKITGLLLYKNSLFMQVLEGKENTVRDLYATICANERHHQVNTMVEISVKQRQFPDWSMGYKHLGTVGVPSVEGY